MQKLNLSKKDIAATMQHLQDLGRELDKLVQEDEHGNTPLIIAAHHNNVDLVRALIATKHDVSTTNNYAETALDYAYSNLEKERSDEEHKKTLAIITALIEAQPFSQPIFEYSGTVALIAIGMACVAYLYAASPSHFMRALQSKVFFGVLVVLFVAFVLLLIVKAITYGLKSTSTPTNS